MENNTTTIAGRRNAQLDRHYSALESLARLCGLGAANGKRMSSKLRLIERKANADATKYCNGDLTTEQFAELDSKYSEEVQALFNNKLEGFFVNSDPRGYSLKISDKLMKPGQMYAEICLQTDWGGYGLLAPEITGK